MRTAHRCRAGDRIVPFAASHTWNKVLPGIYCFRQVPKLSTVSNIIRTHGDRHINRNIRLLSGSKQELYKSRGLIGGMDENPSGKVVTAEVPLAEMFGYATDLRSATQGRATYTMEFSRYAEAPAAVAEGIIAKNR